MAAPHPSETRYRRILASRREDETLVALARRFGVNRRTLYWWNRRLPALEAEEAEDDTQPLVPVEVPADLLGLRATAPDFEVALRDSGHVLRIPAAFDAAALRRLVETLERP